MSGDEGDTSEKLHLSLSQRVYLYLYARLCR